MEEFFQNFCGLLRISELYYKSYDEDSSSNFYRALKAPKLHYTLFLLVFPISKQLLPLPIIYLVSFLYTKLLAHSQSGTYITYSSPPTNLHMCCKRLGRYLDLIIVIY